MSELLRLRAQTGQLKRDLAAASSATQSRATRTTPAEPTSPTSEDSTKPFTAAFTARVPTGQSLLTGGWNSSPGMRTFIMVTPTPVTATGQRADGPTPGSDPRQALFESMIFEVPEIMLAQLGLDQLTAANRESSLQNVLAATDAKGLLDALKTTDGVNILGQPRVVTTDGNGASVSISSADGPNGPGSIGTKSIGFTPPLCAGRFRH